MKTLSPTEARANLSSLLKRAVAGEDIGILCNGRVVALRPVEIQSTDYAYREYGLAPTEMKSFARRADEKIKRDRKAGRTRKFTGDIEAILGD